MKLPTFNHLSLFSGYEGFGLGLKLAGLDIETVGYCEYDKYCQEIIRQRVRDGFLDDAPIWQDVRDFPGHLFNGKVDILTAGFPCQGWSYSGRRKGKTDPRNMWPDTLRIIAEVGPEFVLLENVPGIKRYYFNTIKPELRELGYLSSEGCYTAAEIGAYHRRERLWILAYSVGFRPSRTTEQKGQCKAMEQSQFIGDDVKNGMVAGFGELSAWPIEDRVSGMADGYSDWVDRTRSTGNGIVPAVVAEFLRRIVR